MIDQLTLKFGSSKGQPNLQIEVTPITIFVGPNNSGKSIVLREIERFCNDGSNVVTNLVLEKITFSGYTKDEFLKEIDAITIKPDFGEQLNEGAIVIGKVSAQKNQTIREHIHKDSLILAALNPNGSNAYYYRLFLRMYTLRLDGTNRLNLLGEQATGDLLLTPINHLAHLFINDKLRLELRRIIYEAFEKFYVVDPTKVGTLRVKLSDITPPNEQVEKGWGKDSIDFYKSAIEIKNMSDGVRAFCGIMTTLLAGDPKITLIDEPEAFLHPTLANKLGKEIGTSLMSTRKRFFAATHSANFLMGCIQSGSPMNVVRLTYKEGVATARLLPSEKIIHLMRNPLLRSTGVLNGLFYDAVVVCEGDADRAFYQEINERLLAISDPRGISNCLFVNAQNKQTVWDIVKPLRELGIPAVGIVDIDVIKEGGQVFTKPLEGAFIPELNRATLHTQRSLILKAFEKSGKNMKRDGGIDILNKSDKEGCENFFQQLGEYGVFVIKKGELESWLKPLNATAHGPGWLLNIFSEMKENPLDKDYLKPAVGDVWDFIGEIKLWVENPLRKGIPE